MFIPLAACERVPFAILLELNDLLSYREHEVHKGIRRRRMDGLQLAH